MAGMTSKTANGGSLSLLYSFVLLHLGSRLP